LVLGTFTYSRFEAKSNRSSHHVRFDGYKATVK